MISILLALLYYVSVTTADFLISNSTLCFGVPKNCVRGAQVITGTAYTCSHLLPAQDSSYIVNGTIGPHGEANLYVKDVCGAGGMNLQKDGEGYFVTDGSGKTVADCSLLATSTTRACNEFVGTVGFRSVYTCTSSLCEN